MRRLRIRVAEARSAVAERAGPWTTVVALTATNEWCQFSWRRISAPEPTRAHTVSGRMFAFAGRPWWGKEQIYREVRAILDRYGQGEALAGEDLALVLAMCEVNPVWPNPADVISVRVVRHPKGARWRLLLADTRDVASRPLVLREWMRSRWTWDAIAAAQEADYPVLAERSSLARYANEYLAAHPELRSKAGRIGAATANARRRRCAECGLVSNPAVLGYHQRRRGHEGYEDVA
jgi:hypothetical protein